MPADITTFAAGRVIESVWKNGSILCLRCEDGTEVHIAWRDKAGDPVDGEPCVVWHGKNIICKTARMGALGQRHG